MCGISGFIDFKFSSNQQVLEKMNRTMIHRGPDGEGYYFEQLQTAQIGFGHRRLSIIDLSNNGTQPMHYDNYSILLNGEIYNYQEIKNELITLGHSFKSTSDTEVVLHAYIQWQEQCIHKFIGMFAIVILDRQKQNVFMCRDRAGVKPFYYYWHNDLFLFASELKAFHQHPKFIKEIDIASVANFLQYGNVPAPNCIFKNCYKIKPGYYFNLNLQTKQIEQKQYWNVYDYYNKPKIQIHENDAINQTEKILTKAFLYRMVADVPVGVFLSGGYDSTSVVALLQKNIGHKLKTFTIGVGEEKLNEAPFAKKISEHLGTEHTEYYCTEEDALNFIKDLPFFYDEPFGDSSAIPTMLVSKMARQNVTVSLSADAGDEIFAGYNRYDYANKYLARIKSIPAPLRKITAELMNAINPSHIPYFSNHPLFLYRYRKINDIIKNPNSKTLMNILSAEFSDEDVKKFFVEKNFTVNSTLYSTNEYLGNANDDISIMQAIDFQTYMADDILQKVDRATMAVSLEGREPFLDQSIIQWVAPLPTNLKYKDGIKKYLLKEIVHRHIPRNLMERPKMGFAIPISKWLNNELKPLVDEFINEEKLIHQQFFNKQEILNLKNNFYKGRHELSIKLWYVLMFQMWYSKWMN